MLVCPSCGGFVPEARVCCPNCGDAMPAPRVGGGRGLKAATRVAVVASASLTLVACYGGPINDGSFVITGTSGAGAGIAPASGITVFHPIDGMPSDAMPNATGSGGAGLAGAGAGGVNVGSGGRTQQVPTTCATLPLPGNLPFGTTQELTPIATRARGSCEPANAALGGGFSGVLERARPVKIEMRAETPFTLSVHHNCDSEMACIASETDPNPIRRNQVASVDLILPTGRTDIVVAAAPGVVDDLSFSLWITELP